jgi:hypothetical protein
MTNLLHPDVTLFTQRLTKITLRFHFFSMASSFTSSQLVAKTFALHWDPSLAIHPLTIYLGATLDLSLCLIA